MEFRLYNHNMGRGGGLLNDGEHVLSCTAFLFLVIFCFSVPFPSNHNHSDEISQTIEVISFLDRY